MSDSSEQFLEILSHIVTRANKALATSNQIPPMYIALDNSMTIEIGLGIPGEELAPTLNTFQNTLKEKAENSSIIACGMTYPDYKEECVIAFLENNENYCSTFSIPVVHQGGSFRLQLDDVTESDGTVYVFQNVDDS